MSNLERVREIIEKAKGHLDGGFVRSEADVRLYILNPLLRSLGWDMEDPGVIRREYAVTGGKNYFFDYALFDHHASVVFVIEAKAPGRLDGAARDQLLLYAMKTQTRLGLTTDGRVWSFYLPLGHGSSAERLVREVDLGAAGTEAAANLLERYLARDRVLSGFALRAAEGDRERLALHRSVQSGWADLVGGPSEKLVKVVAGAARAQAAGAGASAPSGRALNDAVRTFIRHEFSFPLEVASVAEKKAARGLPEPDARPPARSSSRSARVRGRAAWTYRGERRVEKDVTAMYVAVIGQLYEDCGGVDFYERLGEAIQGTTRRHIGKTPAETGLLPQHQKYARKVRGDWYLNTNLGTDGKLLNLKRACKVAGIAYGSDLLIETGPAVPPG